MSGSCTVFTPLQYIYICTAFTPPETNMIHLKMNPCKRRFRSWQPLFEVNHVLVFGGFSPSGSLKEHQILVARGKSSCHIGQRMMAMTMCGLASMTLWSNGWMGKTEVHMLFGSINFLMFINVRQCLSSLVRCRCARNKQVKQQAPWRDVYCFYIVFGGKSHDIWSPGNSLFPFWDG